jgi:integrase
MSARRPHGTGSLLVVRRAGGPVYYAKFRDSAGQQVKRRVGPVRTPHEPDGLTKTQAEARLRDLIAAVAAVSAERRSARTLDAAAAAWLTHLEATGTKASSLRAYRAALAWFLPALGRRALDRITETDVEHAMGQMRKAGLSDKTVRNYVGVLRALFNFAGDKRRKWTRRNPAAVVELPKAPTYTEIRYLTPAEVWALADAARAPAERALYLTAAMTGLRIGELQALDWRSVDFVHARVRVRRTWDRKAKVFTAPKSRRSERAVPMPDVVAGELARLEKFHDVVKPDSLVFGDPLSGQPLGWRRLYESLRAALKAAGLDESFGFHSLRHSYGTALAARGVPMRTLQEWMGHRDIQTTQRYADYCPNHGEREVVEAAFGALRVAPRDELRTGNQA